LLNIFQRKDDILYPLADKVLSPKDKEKLLEKFEEVERERIGDSEKKLFSELNLHLQAVSEGLPSFWAYSLKVFHNLLNLSFYGYLLWL
jgi:hypothetical protein